MRKVSKMSDQELERELLKHDVRVKRYNNVKLAIYITIIGIILIIGIYIFIKVKEGIKKINQDLDQTQNYIIEEETTEGNKEIELPILNIP